MVEIKKRFTGEVICTDETIRAAVLANLKILGGADLRGAYLRGADLGGAATRAKLAWQSHDLIAEILKRAAGDDLAKLKVAGLKCWSDFLRLRDPLTGWALGVLRPWADEDAPIELRMALKEKVNEIP